MINKYKIIILLGIIIVISTAFLILISFRVHDYNEYIDKTLNTFEKNWIINHYEQYKKYIEINEKGESILRVTDLSMGGTYHVPMHANDDFDLCLGYYIIKEENDALNIDDSHVCDYMS